MKSMRDSELEEVPRCADGCSFGHCTAMSQPWFRRVLTLERKRSERSRVPFVLVLLQLQQAERLNGNRGPFVHRVAQALASTMRETDVSGWYENDTILGGIYTELGHTHRAEQSRASIVNKLICALQARLNEEELPLVAVTAHIFPEDRPDKHSGVPFDGRLYPEQKRSSWLHSMGKRISDIAGSMLALLLLSPILLILALLVKLSSRGPVLFSQTRVGQFGKPFTFLKFRTMHTQNDPAIHQNYIAEFISGQKSDGNSGVYKIRQDPRITKIGGFLRKTSLDELPQFWNVLKGEMSLVGPRPPIPYEVNLYDAWHRRRFLHAKPGITGLWQVTGRSRTTFDEMVRLDLRYAETSSLWLDLKILLQTPSAVIGGGGAY